MHSHYTATPRKCRNNYNLMTAVSEASNPSIGRPHIGIKGVGSKTEGRREGPYGGPQASSIGLIISLYFALYPLWALP